MLDALNVWRSTYLERRDSRERPERPTYVWAWTDSARTEPLGTGRLRADRSTVMSARVDRDRGPAQRPAPRHPSSGHRLLLYKVQVQGLYTHGYLDAAGRSRPRKRVQKGIRAFSTCCDSVESSCDTRQARSTGEVSQRHGHGHAGAGTDRVALARVGQRDRVQRVCGSGMLEPVPPMHAVGTVSAERPRYRSPSMLSFQPTPAFRCAHLPRKLVGEHGLQRRHLRRALRQPRCKVPVRLRVPASNPAHSLQRSAGVKRDTRGAVCGASGRERLLERRAKHDMSAERSATREARRERRGKGREERATSDAARVDEGALRAET